MPHHHDHHDHSGSDSGSSHGKKKHGRRKHHHRHHHHKHHHHHSGSSSSSSSSSGSESEGERKEERITTEAPPKQETMAPVVTATEVSPQEVQVAAMGQTLAATTIASQPAKKKLPRKSTALYGGDGGEPFDDGIHGRMVEFTIHSGKVVDGIKILYNNAVSLQHGGEGGEGKTFTFQPNEFIVEMTVRAAKVITEISFKTNMGRSFAPCEGGGNLFLGGKGDEQVLKAPSKAYGLRGVKGRCGKYLDALGLHWGPTGQDE